MKTIILCGGQGTRMKEETEFKPKPLVLVGGQPIIWHIMKIYAHFGYNEFILALGYRGDMIKEYFLHWRTFANNFTLNTKGNEIIFHNNDCDDFKITFVETGLESLTGERVRRLKDYIGDDEEFMITYGDGVADININELIEFHKKQNTVGTITGVKTATRFGLLNIDPATNKINKFYQHKISDIEMEEHSKDYINGGFMVFKKEVFDQIEKDTMIEKVFSPLSEKGELSVFVHDGNWKCMDNYKEVEEMNEFWRKDPFWKVWK
ncbi:MAG: sugar phosphate nucleotidyltransferase [Patescibacteria group bacterium]|jgi:glucose-1-phosphate cytidylyltransferase